MDARIFIEPQQGTTYSEVATLAQRAEELGFDGFFTSDHYVRMGDDSTGLPGPLDAWTTIAGLARDTERLRLGTLVSPITFHNPGQLAIRTAQIDEMSSGRVEVGLGAGWFETEHGAYGIEFPPIAERFDRLTEGLEIITGLWGTPEGERFSFAGEHYTLTDSPALPKPWQRPRPPLIIGGHGKRRTPALAAIHAREFNIAFAAPDDWKAVTGPVVEACEARERDPETLVWSAAQVLAVGSSEAEFSRRAEAIGRETPELRQNGVAGLVDEAVERLASFRDAGCTRMYFQVLDLKDLEHLATLDEVLTQLG
ncbi:MAG: LLM class F420-dependent oxidoreductase [Acidimicrobiia bacterium]|nr:LLM class F420-dependent oxidoreductase [Acidimicrobiia bacterium]